MLYFHASSNECFGITSGNRKPRNCVFSLKCCMLLYKKKHTKHIINITWSQLNHAPITVKWLTVCTRQDLRREYSIVQFVPSRLMFTKSVTVSVDASKMGVILIKHGVKVNGQYCWDILLFQQMIDAINASLLTILSFNKTLHWCILRSTQSNCCSARLLTFFLLTCCPITIHAEVNSNDHEIWAWAASNRVNKLSQQLVEVWKCNSTAFEWKNAIFVSAFRQVV